MRNKRGSTEKIKGRAGNSGEDKEEIKREENKERREKMKIK